MMTLNTVSVPEDPLRLFFTDYRLPRTVGRVDSKLRLHIPMYPLR